MEAGETKPEEDVKTVSGKAAAEDERVVTIKIDLRGPAEFVSWMRENRPARAGMFPRLSSMLPPGTREHMISARREQILAIRSVVDGVFDAMINRLERAASAETSERRATKVEVE
jgi:hypothetical protein